MLNRFSRRLQKRLAAMLIGGASLFSVGTFDFGCSGSLDDAWGSFGGIQFGSVQEQGEVLYQDDRSD